MYVYSETGSFKKERGEKCVQSSVSWPKRVICLFLVPKTIFVFRNIILFQRFCVESQNREKYNSLCVLFSLFNNSIYRVNI